jgi:hypothetical protein
MKKTAPMATIHKRLPIDVIIIASFNDCGDRVYKQKTPDCLNQVLPILGIISRAMSIADRC